MSKAPASTRATDHAQLSFGLVSIPVSVFTGTVSDQGIKRKEFVSVPVMEPVLSNTTGQPFLDRAGAPIELPQTVELITDDGEITQVEVVEDHPVGRMAQDKVTGEPLPYGAEVVRKIDTEYGFVFVEDQEIEQLFEITPKSIVVKTFQPLHLFTSGRNYVPKSLYFVEPAKLTSGKKKVANPQAQKLLAMVFKGMREEGVMAVVEFTTRGIPKPGILLPDGSLWLVYHTDALREQRPLEEVPINEALVTQARTLIQANLSDTPLDLTDKRSELIQDFADKKAAAGDFGRTTVEPDEGFEVAATDDSELLAMLQASVDAAQKAG